MNFNMPWLISRKQTIFSSFLDLILIILFTLKFSNEINIYKLNSEYILLPFVWLIISYILGRYSKQDNSYKLIIFRNSFVILLNSIIFFIIVTFYSIFLKYFFEINLFNFSSELFIFGFYLFFSSYIIQTFINMISKKFFTNKKVWLFLGSQNSYKNLRELINSSRLGISLKKVNIDQIALNDFYRFNGIIYDDINSILEKDYELFLTLKSQTFLVLSTFEWCEMILQRYPPKLVNSRFLLSNYFCANKKFVQLRLKRTAELLISLLLIIFSFPLIIFAAFLIKLEDGGDIFYSQIRTGFAGNTFKILKLRSMKIDAEKFGVQWSNKNDTRITKIGSILRLTRLDELPQLIAVIKGEMSLIGPRPERPEIEKMLEEKIPHYRLRHIMRPGLSGWAQVNYPYGASVEDTENKLSYDLYYLKNFSIFLDILILFKTIKIVFKASGAIPNSKG
tara:strand:- start:5586 stop:6935 length:1350 start_codon:yes stop_codon:yes gene_type:complete